MKHHIYFGYNILILMSQLFKKNPDQELFSKIIQTLGIDEFKEDFSFRKKDLAKKF